jgi:DNA-directed RNA polymerase specialized sigma subunit
VRNDDNWQEWDFPKLVEALRKWTERNTLQIKDHDNKNDSKFTYRGGKLSGQRDRAFQARQSEVKRVCVYAKVESIDQRIVIRLYKRSTCVSIARVLNI